MSWPDMGSVFAAMRRHESRTSSGEHLSPKHLYEDMWRSLRKDPEKDKHKVMPREDEETRLARRFKDVFIRIQVSTLGIRPMTIK